MKLTGYIEVSTVIINLSLGLFLLNRSRRSKSTYLFILHILFTSLWGAALYLFDNPIIGNSCFWMKMVFTTSYFVLGTVYLFSANFPKKVNASHIAPVVLLIIQGFITLLGFWLNNWFIKDVISHDGWSEAVTTNYYLYYNLLSSSVVIFFFRNLLYSWKVAGGIEKSQIRFLIIGYILQSIPALTADIILPNFFSNSRYFGVSASSSIIFIAIVIYSMIKHRFLGIKFILGKILHFTLNSILPFSTFYLVIWLEIRIWGSVFVTSAVLVNVGVALLYVILSQRVDKLISQLLEKKLMFSEYNPYEVVNSLLKKTSTELAIDKVVLNVLSAAKQAFEIEQMGLVLFDRNNRRILYRKLVGFDEKAQRNMRDLLEVVAFWEYQESQGKESEILVYEELLKDIHQRDVEEAKRLKKCINFMEIEGIAVLLPLNRKVQLNGLLLVGNKDQSEAFSVQDINLLESIVANASVAVGRALLYKEVQEFAINLEKKVDRATVQLRDKVEALQEARRREQDMVDILGHELRTPMSIIKSGFGFLGMISKHKVYPNIDTDTKDKIEKYYDRVNENIEREIKLIDTLLGATKIDKGKLDLKLESVDIIDVIEDGLVGQRKFAERKSLRLDFENPEEWERYPRVLADRARIQEVMDNLLSNAVKYTFDGSVKVEVEHDEEFVTVHVTDTGIGIPKGALNNLGKKFYRVKQYTDESKERDLKMVRSGGTGLGLYVTYGIVKAQGGRIWVDSTEGEGTFFHFTIPLFKPDNEHQEGGFERDVFKRQELKE